MEQKQDKPQFAIRAKDYVLIAIGFGLVVLGFVLMTGSGATDPNVFNEDIFSFRRITLAPIVVILGFALVFYAIIRKPKQKK